MKLTDLQIKAAKQTGKLSDGAGLYLDVTKGGRKVWRYRFKLEGKENIYTIGDYPAVRLVEARKQREQARALVKQGINPTLSRRAAVAVNLVANKNTLEAVAREWMSRRHVAESTRAQTERHMVKDVFPKLGSMPIDAIRPAQILALMEALEKRGAHSVALLVRQWLSAIFRFAIQTQRAEADPAATLIGVVRRPRTTHSRALSVAELGHFMRTVDDHSARLTAIALRLAALTFVRSCELSGARWDEIDIDSAMWIIPAERMKMRDLHKVPLAKQAVELLRELRGYTGDREYLFPNRHDPRRPMTRAMISQALARMEITGFSAHGFRATASSMLNEMGFNPDAIERQLAHGHRDKIRAAYNRFEYMEDRTTMMQAWADRLDNLSGNPKAQQRQREA